MQNFDAYEKSRKKFIKSTQPEFSKRYEILFFALVVLYFGGHLVYYLYTH